MDMPIKEGSEDDRNTQKTPVEFKSTINPRLEKDVCKRCGVRHNCEGRHYHRGHHRRHRWRRFKETVTSLLIVMGICFFVALLLTYVTGGLPTLVEKIISKNIEKALKRTTAEFAEGKFSPEALKGLGKDIDINKLKEDTLKNLGGWGGNRGEKQSPDESKGQEDYMKSMSRDDLEKKKEYYKEKYKEFLRK